MPPIPSSRADLLAAARLCNWPHVTYGDHRGDGEATWRALVARTTPPDRNALIRQLAVPLCRATVPGREHWDQWLEEGAPTPSRDAVPTVMGDSAFLPVVSAAIQTLPDAVRHRVLATPIPFTCVGISLAGFTSPPSSAPLVIFLSAEADVRVIRHEIAHAWSYYGRGAPPTALAFSAALLAAERWPDVKADYVADERFADLCAWAWT